MGRHPASSRSPAVGRDSRPGLKDSTEDGRLRIAYRPKAAAGDMRTVDASLIPHSTIPVTSPGLASSPVKVAAATSGK